MTKEMNQKEKILICFVLAFAFLGYACLKYNQIFGNDEIAFTKRSQFINETLRWSRCGLLQCATLMVPLNYSDPNSITIGIALNKYKPFFRKPKTRILFNPGGPGSSGMDIIKSSGFFLSSLFGGDAELIGFDPRGVGSSSPVNCVSPGPQMNYGKGYLVFGAYSLPQDASKEQKLYFDSTQKLNAELCELNAGDILGHASTANVARDMDQMRKALGMEKLNFWGMSYGSVLGTTYANMFPDNIGNIVLDGIVDPVSYYGDAIKFVESTVQNIDDALQKVTNDCDDTTACSLNIQGGKALESIQQLIKKLKEEPMIITDGPFPGVLTSEMVENILVSSLYSLPSWHLAVDGIMLALNGEPNLLYEMIGGSIVDTNANSQHMAILCADGGDSTHYSLDEWMTRVDELKSSILPSSAYIIGTQRMECRHWKRFPAQERYTGPWNNKFANPLLLIGKPYDPVTPLVNAQKTHELMKRDDGTINSILLIQNGMGHTSLTHPSVCTLNIIRDYFLLGKMPGNQTICDPTTPIYSENGGRGDSRLEIAENIFREIRKIFK